MVIDRLCLINQNGIFLIVICVNTLNIKKPSPDAKWQHVKLTYLICDSYLKDIFVVLNAGFIHIIDGTVR